MIAGQKCVLLRDKEDIVLFYKNHIGVRVDELSDSMKNVIGLNIITATNDQHPGFRKRYKQHFRGTQMDKYAEIMKQVIELYPPSGQFVVQDYATRIAGITAIAAFSECHPDEIDPKLADDVMIVFDNIRTNMIALRKRVPPEVIRARDHVYEFITSLIPKYANTQTVLGDIIDYCVKTYNSDESRLRICEELFSLFVGGSETTTSLLTWACYYMAKEPAIQNILRRELGGEIPQYQSKIKYSYLNKFITELLRIKSPTGLGCLRTTTDVVMTRYIIPANTLVFVCPLITHMDSRYWINPREFNPERHADQEDTSGRFFPFGMFHYYCLGKEFSKHETRTLISAILRAGSFELISGDDDDIDIGITVRPKHRFEIKITPLK